MPTTLAQAKEAQEFHIDEGCPVNPGRGGRDKGPFRWRRNGKNKEWRRDQGRIQIPVKYGLHGYGYVTEDDLSGIHVPEDCPRR